MSKPLIELITCESGDWVVLRVEMEEQYTGHSIPDFEWIKLLDNLGFKIEKKCISDKRMEEGNY